MPFICLANANTPNGTLQITDLGSSESQRNNSVDPPSQNRYLNRPATDLLAVDDFTGAVSGVQASANKTVLEGLGAYLLDRVEPGSSLVPASTVTLTGVQAGDEITIKGIIFQFQAGANVLAGRTGVVADEFIVGLGASDAAAAANLVLALNDNGDVSPILDAVAPLNIHSFAPAAVGAAVTIQPENAGAVLQTGAVNQFSVVVSNAARLVLDAASAASGRFSRTVERWDAAQLASAVSGVNGIQTRVDAGLGLTLAEVNVLLLASCNGDLGGTSIAGSNSTGDLQELLSIMAGRRYQIPLGAVKFTPTVSPETVSVWTATQRGSFTVSRQVFDTAMVGGEWGPSTPWVKRGSTVSGGDVSTNDLGGIRSTVDSTHLESSLQTGQLSHYASGVSLFPDAAVSAFVSNWTRRTLRKSTLTNQRVVTVYDDDGTVLA